jgi:hypothetical protein
MKIEHRWGTRVAADFSVGIDGYPFARAAGRCLNVSASGMFVRTAFKTPGQGRVKLHLSRAGKEESVWLWASVTRIAPDGIGFGFDDFRPKELLAWLAPDPGARTLEAAANAPTANALSLESSADLVAPVRQEERRWTPRQSLTLDVMLRGDGFKPQRVACRNIGLGGLFVTAKPSWLTLNSQAWIGFLLMPADDDTRGSFPVRVIRLDADGAALMCGDFSQATLRAMRRVLYPVSPV